MLHAQSEATRFFSEYVAEAVVLQDTACRSFLLWHPGAPVLATIFHLQGRNIRVALTGAICGVEPVQGSVISLAAFLPVVHGYSCKGADQVAGWLQRLGVASTLIFAVQQHESGGGAQHASYA